jgi:hypothetical protein
MFRPADVSKRRLRLGQSLSNLYGDINNISWPSGASGLWTNRLTADGKLADLSGNGNHGTISGPTFRAGPWGPCLYFDGVDDVVTIPDCDGLDLSTHTFFMVMKMGTPTGSWKQLFAKNGAYVCWAYANRTISHNIYIGSAQETSGVIQYGNYWDVLEGYYTGASTGIKCNEVENGISYSGTVDINTNPVIIGGHIFGVEFSVAAIALYPTNKRSEYTALRAQLFGSW